MGCDTHQCGIKTGRWVKRNDWWLRRSWVVLSRLSSLRHRCGCGNGGCGWTGRSCAQYSLEIRFKSKARPTVRNAILILFCKHGRKSLENLSHGVILILRDSRWGQCRSWSAYFQCNWAGVMQCNLREICYRGYRVTPNRGWEPDRYWVTQWRHERMMLMRLRSREENTTRAVWGNLVAVRGAGSEC
jgi:hypothetical protein